MEIAAWWPCATAQMMFSGPHAASPPKNTPGLVDIMVVSSTLGIPHLSNSRPMLRSIQGKLFSWPIAISTSSHGNTTSSPVGSSLGRPLVSMPTSVIFWKRTPARRPFSSTNSLGAWLSKIGMPSCSASSISHGEAFITRLGERTVTFTSMPPSRRLVRQQSMAVLPPPITTTRLPIRCTCSKATDVEPVDADMDVGCGLLAARDVEVFALGGAGADEDGVEPLLRATHRGS